MIALPMPTTSMVASLILHPYIGQVYPREYCGKAG
jgi:hypothetical protein